MSSTPPHILVVGGGAAGFFAAIAAAQSHPDWTVTLLERSSHVLAKVLVSGGGRCNVTHACFDPAILVTHYPRGSRALRGPFSRFQPQNTIEWFESRGVPLKTEADNRIFPESNRSSSIADCLQKEAERLGVFIRLNAFIQSIHKEDDRFVLDFGASASLKGDRLILASGSSPQGWEWARHLGHTIIPPVPSLFTFRINDRRLDGLSGISVPSATLSVEGMPHRLQGPLLITHEGLSGPVVLKLSAWAARDLHEADYRVPIRVNWISGERDALWERPKKKRDVHKRHVVAADNIPDVPRRLWSSLVAAAGIPAGARWTEASNEHLRALATELTGGLLPLQGKSTFKEEFVTCGGVSLDEVDFRTMQSKKCSGLFFAGEILDIDAETGGFNFQNAWTTGWIAGHSL